MDSAETIDRLATSLARVADLLRVQARRMRGAAAGLEVDLAHEVRTAALRLEGEADDLGRLRRRLLSPPAE